MGLLKRFGLLLAANAILSIVWNGAANIMDGKDFFGRKRRVVQRKETYVNHRGQIVMGVNDYQVN